MTKEELNRRRMMFQINAKRNELLKPEDIGTSTVRHSATNDFLAFRKKVAAGMKKQKEQNVEVFNVTAANLQNYQDMLDNNELIHAGMNNQYIAKLDDFYGKGKPRYFYDQTEWDNYRKNMQGAGQAAADRGAKEGADAKNKNLANKAQEAFTNAVEKDSKNKDLVNKAQEAFNKTANTEFKTNTGVYKNKNFLDSNQKNKENAIKRSTPEYKKELEKAKTIKEDKERWAAYSSSDLDDVINDRRFKNIKTEDDVVNYPGGVEKLYNDLEAALEEKHPGKKNNYEASKNAGADRAAKESEVANSEKENKANEKKAKLEEQQNKREEAAKSGTKTTESYTEQVKRNTDFAKEAASTNDDGSLDEEGKEYVDWVKNETLKNLKTPERHQMEKDIVKDATKPGTTIDDLSLKYGIPASDIRTVLWFNGIKKPAEDKRDLDTRRHNNVIANKWSKEDAIANSKKGVKHDGLEDGITTSAELTPEQEYIAFRKKVEAGMKHFGLNRNLMTVPKNQALADGDSMSHAGTGNFKYYNKIKLPSGEVRYFYTKEEWDAYNNQVKENNNEDSKNLEWQRKHVLNNGDGRSFNQKELKQYESYNKSLKNKDSSNLTVKEGFISKGSKNIKNAAQDVSKDIANLNITSKSERNAINGLLHDKCTILEKKYESKFDDIKKNIPDQYPFKNEFVDLDDTLRSTVKDIESQVIKEYLNNKDGKALTESGTMIDSKFKDVESNLEKEISKREKSIESYNNLRKSFNKIKTIEDDTKNLSKFEEQVLADELGISEWSEEAIAKKYGIDENSAKDPGDDYGASNFDKLAEAYDAFWNDYKAAKKAINSSASKAKEESD